MRQWMCDPSILCNKHLLGEHLEHHMFVGSINKGTSIQGYLDKNLLQIGSLKHRHQQLVDEMTMRGMHHKSPLPEVDISNVTTKQLCVIINRHDAVNDITSRCKVCRSNWDLKYGSGTRELVDTNVSKASDG
jgi:hypothetical protein